MAETLLTVKHLVKQYGDHIVLNDISLDIKKGEVIVVVGPSGCGKSTLLRCINALEPIQGGVIELGDIPIEAKSKSLISLDRRSEWCSKVMIYFRILQCWITFC